MPSAPSVGLSPEFLEFANPAPPQAQGPSLAGPDMFGHAGARTAVNRRPAGIGGTQAPALNNYQRTPTPEELMAWANAQEQQYVEGSLQAQQPHMSSVEGSFGQNPSSVQVPQWLEEYMHQDQDPLDSLKHRQYDEERKALRETKSQSDVL